MTADQQPAASDGDGEDYSYDLAHDVPEAVRRTDDPRVLRDRAPEAEPQVDPAAGDYSYDLAHEVPRSTRD